MTAYGPTTANADQAALGDLYDRYGGLVYSVTKHILKDAGAVEEVLQDIFYQLWRVAASFDAARGTLGCWLAEHRLATAMLDLSDGLSSDLPRLCAASGVGARLERAKIPMVQLSTAGRRRGIDPLQLALHGGDDYELVFTVPPGKAKFLPKIFRGLALSPIGKIISYIRKNLPRPRALESSLM